MEPVVNADGEQEHGNGIHGGVEGHVHACKLQPPRETVSGSDGNHGEDEHVGGFSNASEIEPQNDAQQQHGCTGQHADLLPDGGAVVLCELSERERAHVTVVGGRDDLELHGLRPRRQVRLNIPEDVVAVIEGLAGHHKGDHDRTVRHPRVVGVLAR